MTPELQVPDVPRLGARAALFLFLLALGVRVAAVSVVGFASVGFGDGRAYLGAARALARTGHYPVQTDAFFFRAPGYPVFLVLSTFGHPDRIPLAKLGDATAGALAAPLLAALSARLFRRKGLALFTGIAAALHPSFVLVSTDVQSESPFLLLLLAAGLLLLAALDRPSSNLAVGAGLLLGLAALTRPSALAIGILLAAPLADRRYPWRARAHLAASAALGFFLALAPWTLRNAIVFHEFIPISDSFGTAFYEGNSDSTERFYAVKTRPDYERWLVEMSQEKMRRLREVDPGGILSPQKRSRALAELALQDLRRDPREAALLYLRKTAQWLRPYPTAWYYPLWIVVLVGIYYSLLYAASLVGLRSAPRPGAALFCVSLLGLTMIFHILVVPLWRYRVPYWDPVLLLYGSFGGDKIASRWWLRRP